MTTGRVNVQNYEINQDIPDEEFKPKLPTGTFVVTDTKGVGGETVSVVRDSGRPGVPLPLADRPTYDELLAANRSSYRQWLWIGGGVLIAAAVVVAVVRRRRAGRP